MLIEGVKASGLEAKLVVDENVSNFQQLITLICGNNEKVVRSAM